MFSCLRSGNFWVDSSDAWESGLTVEEYISVSIVAADATLVVIVVKTSYEGARVIHGLIKGSDSGTIRTIPGSSAKIM
jgi:hypothetical protein